MKRTHGYYNQTSFMNLHSPTRAELDEFLSNCTSFNKYGTCKPSAILDKNGEPVPAIIFMKLNSTLSHNSNRRINPLETLFFLPTPPEDIKWKTPRETALLKQLKKECDTKIRKEGGNPKKWKLYAVIEG